MTLKVVADTHLRIDKSLLDRQINDFLKQALTFENPEKETAKRELAAGWQYIPDTVELYDVDDQHLILPRGFASSLLYGLESMGINVHFVDRREGPTTDEFSQLVPISLKSHQGPAVDALLQAQQGIYQAPTGSGKTVTSLEAIRRAGRTALVLTDKSGIAEQWRQRSREHLGYEPGLIGDGVWDERDLSIALVQTLWSRREVLDKEGWWNRWGLVLVDECHHLPAASVQDIVQRFPALFRIGVSATPKKNQRIVPVAINVIGDIVHETSEEELRATGTLVKPKVQIVRTEFQFKFHSTHIDERGKLRRNNYQSLLKALISDFKRNTLIAHHVLENRGHHNLVISKRLGHLDAIAQRCVDLGWPTESVLFLRGKESREERAQIAVDVESLSESLLLSTIADEALDIPKLDRIHLTYPTKNTDLVKQQIGRIKRTHPDKTDAIVYDYLDQDCGVLGNQFKHRRIGVYSPERLSTYET